MLKPLLWVCSVVLIVVNETSIGQDLAFGVGQSAQTVGYQKNEILPVLFRLIYTCALRPNEGRELLAENDNLETGEILITHQTQ